MFGKKLKELREGRELSMDKLIELYNGKYDAKMNKSTLSRYENGLQDPIYTVVVNLANFFDVSVDYILGRSSTPSNIYPVEGLVSFEEIGTVKAGYNGMADETPTGKIVDIPAAMLNGRPKEDFFMLRVNGDSMYPTLVDGDSILVQRCTSVDSGTLSVVLYNGDEASVKKVNYVFGEDWMELIPINPEYKTKRIEGPDLEQCRVLGKVVKLIREF